MKAYFLIMGENFNKGVIIVADGKLQLVGTLFDLELEYQEKRYEYSERVDHYWDATRYTVYWFGQGKLTCKQNSDVITYTFLFETERFNAQYIGGKFYFADFSRVLFMCRPISGNEYRRDAVYFSLEMAVDRQTTIDLLCQKIKDVLDKPSDKIIRNIVIPRVKIEELQALGLAPEGGGQLRIAEV